MGDCATNFNPLSQLSKVANNSNSFVHKHLRKSQNDIPSQNHKQSNTNPQFNSSFNIQNLNSSLSNVSISSSWNQEYKDFKNLDRSASMRSSDVAVSNSMLNLKKSMTPMSLESTPGLKLMSGSPLCLSQQSMMNIARMEQQHINKQWETKFAEQESKLISDDLLSDNAQISNNILEDQAVSTDKFEQV